MTRKKEKTELAFGKIPAYCKYELFMERYRSAAEFIRLALNHNHPVKLLDVGCGNGYLKYFCDFGTIEWHGIEIWEERFKDCQRLGYTMHWCDIDNDRLPFKNQFFDIVVASHVLEHLQNRSFALQEIYRVLKNGGLMIVGTPIKPVLVSDVMNFVYSFRAINKGETAHNFDIYSLKRFITENLPGAQIVDIRGFRIISARKTRDWENKLNFYKFNTVIGKTVPSITPEVNVVLVKNGSKEDVQKFLQAKRGEPVSQTL
ncbi:MAG: class I SAM-dependent methyltransferase [Desulfobaccales bacterium]